jgi:hypothetical protein
VNKKRILRFASPSALLFLSLLVDSQLLGGRETPELILSDTKPTARAPIPAAFWNHPKPILEVPISRIENASQLSFSIFVYVEWASTNSGSPHKTLLGNFSIYPPDRVGIYVLRASEGLRPLLSSGIPPEERHASVLLELKPTSPNSTWRPIQVSVAPVRWRDDSPALE